MTKEDPHDPDFLEQSDITALEYAFNLAHHMLECEGVVHSETWKDLPSYKEGFKTGCMAIAEALDHALTKLREDQTYDLDHSKRTKNHDK